MPDGFDTPGFHGVIDVPPPAKRQPRNNTAIRVTEIVMAPLTVLVGGSLILAGMVLWGLWIVGCRGIRPLLYTVAGIAAVTLVLLLGGVMGYAYHAYQLTTGRPVDLAEAPLPAPGSPSLDALPPPSRAPAQPPPAPPRTDPFGLRP